MNAQPSGRPRQLDAVWGLAALGMVIWPYWAPEGPLLLPCPAPVPNEARPHRTRVLGGAAPALSKTARPTTSSHTAQHML